MTLNWIACSLELFLFGYSCVKLVTGTTKKALYGAIAGVSFVAFLYYLGRIIVPYLSRFL